MQSPSLNKWWLIGSLAEHPLVPYLAQRFEEATEYIQLTPSAGGSLSLAELTQQRYQIGEGIIYLNTPWRFAQQDTLEEHLTLSLNLFHACLKQDARLIYLSTHAVYGEAHYSPLDEQHPLQGFSPYASSRMATDLLAQSYASSFDLNVTVLRLFPIFGPAYYRQWLLSLHTHREALADLELQFDLLHLEDAIEALHQVAQHPDLKGQVFNLGSGQLYSLDTLLAAIPAELSHSSEALTLDLATTRKTAQFLNQRSSDLSRLQQRLPWTPHKTAQILEASQPLS